MNINRTGLSPGADRGGRERRHLVAVFYMLGATVVWAIVPSVMDFTEGIEHPFLFSSGLRLGGAIGCLSFLLLRYSGLLSEFCRLILSRPDTPSRREMRQKVGHPFNLSCLIGWSLPFAVFGKFEYVFFAYAAQVMAIHAVTITYEIWPIVMILTMGVLFRGEETYKRTGIGTFLMLGLCLVGFALVVLPEGVGHTEVQHSVSIVLVLVAALVGGTHNAVIFKWGNVMGDVLGQFRDQFRFPRGFESSSGSPVIFATVLAQGLVQVVCFSLCLVIGFAIGERIEWFAFLISILGGFLVAGIGDVSFRIANSYTDNLGVNALSYLTPILALAWLALFSQAEVSRLDYLLVGAIAVITANLLVNFESEIRWGFKAVILALVIGGAVVYLRDGVFDYLGVDRWEWTAGGYFEALALSATVFTLLLAFRVARLISRTGEEENRTFSAFRRLDMLVQRDVISPNILDCVVRMDSPKDQDKLASAYREARGYMNAARANVVSMKDVDLQLLAEAESILDTLARSKQQDITLGEMFALFIFGGITVSLALFSRPPETEGWTRFLVDLFAMLISAVIVFLVVNVWDLRRERDEIKLQQVDGKQVDGKQVDGKQVYEVRFLNTRRYAFDQWLSIIVGGAIVLVYAGLLAHKWVGWFPWLR